MLVGQPRLVGLAQRRKFAFEDEVWETKVGGAWSGGGENAKYRIPMAATMTLLRSIAVCHFLALVSVVVWRDRGLLGLPSVSAEEIGEGETRFQTLLRTFLSPSSESEAGRWASLGLPLVAFADGRYGLILETAADEALRRCPRPAHAKRRHRIR